MYYLRSIFETLTALRTNSARNRYGNYGIIHYNWSSNYRYPEKVMTCFLQYLYMKKPTICNLANDLNRHGNHLVLPMENKMEVSFMFLFQDEKNKNLLNPINYAFFLAYVIAIKPKLYQITLNCIRYWKNMFSTDNPRSMNF